MGREKLEAIQQDQYFELSMLDDEIEVLASRHLLDLAHQLLLPIPAFQEEGGAWERTTHTGEFFLTRQAMKELRQSIREEEKARREGLVTWTAALVGLIGALTGLVSVWKG
ncbi:hypothetical protein D9M68_575780 [compost metagenome]